MDKIRNDPWNIVISLPKRSCLSVDCVRSGWYLMSFNTCSPPNTRNCACLSIVVVTDPVLFLANAERFHHRSFHIYERAAELIVRLAYRTKTYSYTLRTILQKQSHRTYRCITNCTSISFIFLNPFDKQALSDQYSQSTQSGSQAVS